MAGLKKTRKHILVCEHKDCLRRGGRESFKALKHALRDAGERERVLITRVDCLDQCDDGPVMVVYPEGVWYGEVDGAGAREIAAAHTGEGGTGTAASGCRILRDMRGETRGKDEDVPESRTIVVGDVHGCYDELLALLDTVAFSTRDRLVCVGDLIVKGEKNREVLDLFMSDGRFSSVLGNHDRAVLRRLRGEPVTLKPSQEKCCAELEDGRDRYAEYLASLPLMIDLGSHLVVHAGVRPGVSLGEQSIEDLTELRTLGADRASREGVPWYERYEGEKSVLFGHWPAGIPRRGPHALGLDTGCVYGYQLTAYVVETGRLLSVHARRAYAAPAGGAQSHHGRSGEGRA